jgi:hypothetical protein
LDVKKIKRFLALLKSEVELNRNHHLILPDGFKESFENQPKFRGWINYKETWYIDEKDPWRVISISRPLVEDWHDQLRKVVPVITPEGEVVGAEEWEKRSNLMK